MECVWTISAGADTRYGYIRCSNDPYACFIFVYINDDFSLCCLGAVVMKKFIKRCSDFCFKLLIIVAVTPVWAELPVPPSGVIPSGNKGWTDVGQDLILKMLSFACIALGAVILIGVAGGTLKAYQHAHERGDLSYFFKMLFVGLLMAALGLALTYGGYQIVKG